MVGLDNREGVKEGSKKGKGHNKILVLVREPKKGEGRGRPEINSLKEKF